MHTVQFIPTQWLELAAWTPGLAVWSREVQVERRVLDLPVQDERRVLSRLPI